MSVAFEVDRLDRLSPDEFVENYVRLRRPVVVSDGLRRCAAPSLWNLEHLRRCAGDRNIVLKDWGASGIRLDRALLGDYVDALELYESRGDTATAQKPAYLHDVPLTSILPDAGVDLEGFPANFFPSWYGAEWPTFAQLFLGPSGSVTPLHFDCLLTHNLFFQVMGRKKFTLLPHEQIEYCYPYNWRWCEVDVEKPDYDRHPLYRLAKPTEVVVEPGDILYMPPGALHHVRSLDCALSFNVDWHTKDSALRGALSFLRGMPAKNIYYNMIVAFGLWSGVSTKRLLPYYRSYLNYVS
ncbi:cupin-like domain-containing protein [Methylosinus sp. H3A]|uniref:cupin-like domain-containing protein n=1 Tax=Methylosinus sp. H3A TaxID=2785786 RepID=UPI0018C1E577|nr:cupin-like domain-containing protein [Methylosinus sp. H3A]MBG0811169.1 cupin-like domain-containing protein [Methylosinus sp. H3A]